MFTKIEKHALEMLEKHIRERMEYILTPSVYQYGYISKEGIYYCLLELEILAQNFGLFELKEELSEKVVDTRDELIKSYKK